MSSQDESFSDDGLLSMLSTREPASFEGREVPSVASNLRRPRAVAVWGGDNLHCSHSCVAASNTAESAGCYEKDRAYLAELDQQSGDDDE